MERETTMMMSSAVHQESKIRDTTAATSSTTIATPSTNSESSNTSPLVNPCTSSNNGYPDLLLPSLGTFNDCNNNSNNNNKSNINNNANHSNNASDEPTQSASMEVTDSMITLKIENKSLSPSANDDGKDEGCSPTNTDGKRSIFGANVNKKYGYQYQQLQPHRQQQQQQIPVPQCLPSNAVIHEEGEKSVTTNANKDSLDQNNIHATTTNSTGNGNWDEEEEEEGEDSHTSSPIQEIIIPMTSSDSRGELVSTPPPPPPGADLSFPAVEISVDSSTMSNDSDSGSGQFVTLDQLSPLTPHFDGKVFNSHQTLKPRPRKHNWNTYDVADADNENDQTFSYDNKNGIANAQMTKSGSVYHRITSDITQPAGNNTYNTDFTDGVKAETGTFLSSTTTDHDSSSYQKGRKSLTTAPSLSSTDPTVHAQTFVLSLAFLSIWSPQNLMAPNLTQMAEYFNFTPSQRDLYLGANIAFATGVLSLPVSALIGFFADIVSSRKKLFAATVFMGGITSICTGLSTSYTQLYFARFCCGGCMSGSVPIAFSLLGDLFDAKDRNTASSGLTAMMGAGILFGQVYAGTVGETLGWKQPFICSGFSSIVTSMMVLWFVREPVRGGKEKVLQDMIARGTKYNRKLTLHGFLHAMTKNQTNVILMTQGFFTNIPWGVVFTFLNDYLSQEQGLSVQFATFLLFWFGVGCAAGGVLGGFIGAKAMRINRTALPLFMACATFFGIFPFLGLLDLDLKHDPLLASVIALASGCIANLPSVNVRPCLINVNPPETRGAAMTTANLMINVARGAGPSLITMAQVMFGASRQMSFNVILIVFWTITSIQLLVLAKTLPRDQDAMDEELARYAESEINQKNCTQRQMIPSGDSCSSIDVETLFDDMASTTHGGDESIMSIEDRMTSFDAAAAQQSLSFIGDAFREIGEELSSQLGQRGHGGGQGGNNYTVVSDQDGHEVIPDARRHVAWMSQESEDKSLFESNDDSPDSPDHRRGPVIDVNRGSWNNNHFSLGNETAL